ncbi:MAG: hypothetical protein KIC67_06555 [Clostridium butyricum]|nr:hypothetical protein [Clostridium butyricum]
MKSNENFANKFVNAMRSKNTDHIKSNNDIPEIKEMLQKLIMIDDEKWGYYAFRREPLKGKFSEDDKLILINKANECGKKYAQKIREQYSNMNTYDIAKEMGLEVDYPDRPNGGGHIIFAQFVEPNKVTVFKDSINKAEELITSKKLGGLFSDINIEELLLAHEIFHFIEENDDDIFTRTEKIRLWKIGPIKNDSNIVCLGEIAGMAFAKELLKISYSPYILDVFLVYLYNIQASYGLYEEIMSINNKE